MKYQYQPIDSQRICYGCDSFKPGDCRPCNEYIWEVFKQLGYDASIDHLEGLISWTHGLGYKLEAVKASKEINSRINKLQNEIVYNWEDYEENINE